MSREDQRILGLIPARSGSKGLPHKNILPLGGRPMIAWTVDAALQSRSLNRVVVSTDDWLIASIAEQWGAEAPFLRPAELARDDTRTIDVVLHALEWLAAEERYRPDYVMLLQPTSPLRSREDIDGAVDTMVQTQAASVISVGPAHQHPALMRQMDGHGRLHPLRPEDHPPARRQDFDQTYVLNGAIYLARRDDLIRNRSFDEGQACGFIMPPERSVDVDTEWDYRLAQVLAGGQAHEGRMHREPAAGSPAALLHCG